MSVGARYVVLSAVGPNMMYSNGLSEMQAYENRNNPQRLSDKINSNWSQANPSGPLKRIIYSSGLLSNVTTKKSTLK